jgi:predicted Holliday junction resolvase-like endonuclease
VRTGTIIENIVPIIPSLPYNAKNMHHLGQPIDFIHFSYDGMEGPEITFIEVKSGNAKESKRQKLIKKAIQQGKVYYELLTIDDKEIKVKRVKNIE